MTYPLPMTREEAYLAYKAGVITEDELKPSLSKPRNQLEAWLAYWCGITDEYPTKDNEPLMITDEEACIAYLSGVTNTYPTALKDPRDPRIVGYLKYLISVIWGRPQETFNRSELYLSLIMPPIVTNDTPSTDIALYGTVDYKFLDLKMYGDVTQQTYTGKNLLALTGVTSSAGVSGTVNADGSVTISGTATATDGVVVFQVGPIKAGTYTFSISKSLPSVLNLSIAAGVSFRLAAGETSVTTTVSQDYESASVYFAVSNGTTYDETFNCQLESGSSATSWEPYVGGIPAPNPNYPQPVNSVTGQQAVTVRSKNLCGPAAWRAVATPGGYPVPYQPAATIEFSDDNSVVFNVPVDYAGAESCLIPVKAGEVYTVSFDGDNLPSRLFITQYDSSKTRVSTLNQGSVSQVATTTVVTTNDGYIAVAFAATTTSGTYSVEHVQVERLENIFSGDFAQFDNQGGTGSTYAYFKLPDDGEYTMMLVSKGAVSGTSDTYIGFTTAGGMGTSPINWVFSEGKSASGAGVVFTGTNISSGNTLKYVSIFKSDADTFEWFTTNFYICIVKKETISYVPYENTTYPVDLASRNLCTDVSLPYENTLRLDFNKMPTNKFTVTFTTNELLQAASVRLFTLNPEYHNFGIVGNISGVAGGTATTIVTLDDNTYTQLKSAMSKGSPSYITIFKNGANFAIPSDAQIETGDTATPYEPYYEPIELYKIGDYQDYIYKDGDAWMLHREIKKLTLDGTEYWSGSGHVFQTASALDVEDRSETALSNRFKWAYYQSAITQNIKNGEFGWNASNELTVRYDDITGSADFRTWLTTHNVTVYYKNTEETDTEITVPEIVAQLNAIVDGGSCKDATYIKVTASEPNIAGPLTVVAGKE